MMLSKQAILDGLRELDLKARSAEQLVEISVYGGAALAIAFNMRAITKDVDAVVNGDPTFLRAAAAEVANEHGWPLDWLNDGVKGFRSAHEQMEIMSMFQPGSEGGLRVNLPSAEYLFAMKCMAMRPEGVDGSSDISDIEGLAHICRICTAEQALQLVEAFYPARIIPPKVRFGVEEIMERVSMLATPVETNPTDEEASDDADDDFPSPFKRW